MRRRTRLTMILVIAGSSLSLASFPLGYVERFTQQSPRITEFYPFFHWRLYGDPRGTEITSTYRIYSRESDSLGWIRHPIRASRLWSRYHYSQQFNKRVKSYLEESEAIDSTYHSGSVQRASQERQKLISFVESVLGRRPAEVNIVEESFLPLNMLSDSTAYDTTTVVRLVR